MYRIYLHLEYPGQCYDGKHAYNVGVHYPENKCMRLRCTEDFILDFATLVSIEDLRFESFSIIFAIFLHFN